MMALDPRYANQFLEYEGLSIKYSFSKMIKGDDFDERLIYDPEADEFMFLSNPINMRYFFARWNEKNIIEKGSIPFIPESKFTVKDCMADYCYHINTFEGEVESRKRYERVVFVPFTKIGREYTIHYDKAFRHLYENILRYL